MQAREQLVELLKELQTEDATKPGCPAAVALQHIETLKQRHCQQLQQHQKHLQAADFFKERTVVTAVQVRLLKALQCMALTSSGCVHMPISHVISAPCHLLAGLFSNLEAMHLLLLQSACHAHLLSC